MATKPKRNYLVTPEGKARWAKLVTPDTKFVKTGEFKIDLVLTGEAATTLSEKIEGIIRPLYEQFKLDNPKKKAYKLHLPFQPDLDEQGDPTGATVFRFKSKAHVEGKDGKPGFDRKIALFDAKKNEIFGVDPGNGSTVRVSAELAHYCNDSVKDFGGTMRLNAVQILKLVERGGGGFGFQEEEGDTIESREATESAELPKAEAGAEKSEGSESGDF